MNQNDLQNKIWNLKNQIHEIKAYLSSDCCTQCSKMYVKLYGLEQELKNCLELSYQDNTNSSS